MNSLTDRDDAQQLRDWMELVNLQEALAHWKKQKDQSHKQEYVDQTINGLQTRIKEIQSQYYKVVE